MKIYTGSGDRGKTSLFSGERLSKSDLRVEAYGDVDELNSFLGGLVAALPPSAGELALAFLAQLVPFTHLQKPQANLLCHQRRVSSSPVVYNYVYANIVINCFPHQLGCLLYH